VHEVNVTGTLNVLKAAAAAKVEKFLYCSSSEVNGTATVVPMTEDYHYNPETIYGASKLTGEYYTQVFQRSGWLQTVIARPHNTYGPREHYEGHLGEVIPRFILRAFGGKAPTIYGDGMQTRDFTYVTETADFLVRLMESPKTVGETFNVCRGQEVSVREIAALISKLTGLNKEPEYLSARPSDVRRLYGSTEKLKKALGASPSISISDGLQQTVEWFKKHVPLTPEVLASMQAENWESITGESWLNAMEA
jgi:UDP-glucose 4-epimerase